MPRTPDGRLRAPTPAELDLTAVIANAIEAAATNRENGRDPFWLAAAASSAVLDQGWTPPAAGWIPPARPDTPGQGDLLAAPTRSQT